MMIESTCCTPTRAWYQNHLFRIAAVCLLLVIISPLFPQTSRVSTPFWAYIIEMGPPILMGLIIAGIIDYSLPKDMIQQWLSAPKKRTIVTAMGISILFASCSHGILAIAIGLYKKGASTAAVVTILMAAPWVNIPMTMLLMSFFGFHTLYISFSAIIIALVTGLLFQVLERYRWVETQPRAATPQTSSFFSNVTTTWQSLTLNSETMRRHTFGVYRSILSIAQMILWWIIIGTFMASITRAFVPSQWLVSYLGSTLNGLLLTLGLSSVIEICSEGSTPLAAELYHHTRALGNVFVFLMAGVATDYTEIGLLWTTIGWRTAIALPIIAVPMIVVMGYLFNLL